MRPFLLLTAVVLAVALLLPVGAFSQQPVPRPYGTCFYGCGPFIPLLTTPEISLQQFSPSPVGATNATAGLIAGATNSTLSQLEGETSSVYSVAVWYQGGAPMMTPDVHLWPETVGREGHPMHEGLREAMFMNQERREEGPHAFAEGRPHPGHPGEGRMEEHASRHAEEARGDWTYFVGPVTGEGATTANSFKKAAKVYGNDDVTRQNEKNGMVKYDGKTEKM